MIPIYLDHNATTPVAPEVREAMLPFLGEHFGNPSSAHAYGHTAKMAVERARGQVAGLLGCLPEEITFTSGGTESDNHALCGIVEATERSRFHIITSQIEHPAILQTCRYLETQGGEVTYLPVDGFGMVSPTAVAEAIAPHTALITLMHANNEVGTIEPLAEVGEIARAAGIAFHTDAAQSVGKVPTLVDELRVDLLTVAGHKLYAPKGIGALYTRAGTAVGNLLYGGGQENGRRAGTENVPHIVGLGAACELAQSEMAASTPRIQALRDRLHGLLERAPITPRLNGHPVDRLPNTLNLSFEGISSAALLAELPGVAASGGSACHEGREAPSYVLTAMGLPREVALGAVRLTLGRGTHPDEIDAAAEELTQAVGRLGGTLSRGQSAATQQL